MLAVQESRLRPIQGLLRVEEFSREALGERLTELTHTV
jgi:hypothetical protein